MATLEFPRGNSKGTLSPGSLAKETEDLKGEAILGHTICQDYSLWPDLAMLDLVKS